MDKFNGFSQDEINSVEKKINTYSNKSAKTEPTITYQKRTGLGIRRVPEKHVYNNNNNNNNNNNDATKKVRKINGTASASINSAPTTKTMKSSVMSTKCENESSDGSTMENKSLEVSVDRSMSKSIEEALFFQPLKELANKPTTLPQVNEDSTLRSVSTITTNTHTSEEHDNDDNTTATVSAEMPFKGVSLKEFEVHRKLIEEQNNQKKRLLCKAIELQ